VLLEPLKVKHLQAKAEEILQKRQASKALGLVTPVPETDNSLEIAVSPAS
jgi:hypothetical protein